MANVVAFISYSSWDRQEALAVKDLLTARGCVVWMDVFDIRVGADVKHELGDGIENADVLCLLLSPTAVSSRWVTLEIERGEEQALKRGLRIVPVLLRHCRLPDRFIERVMLDATAGITSPDVQAVLARAVLGHSAVDDLEIDRALKEALNARRNEIEAARVLPKLAEQLNPIFATPIRHIEISFRQKALPRNTALAVSLTYDAFFAQPIWFVFAEYREGQTWPQCVEFDELEHSEIRSDGKRIDGCFRWRDRVMPLSAVIDGTDLRDRNAEFHIEFGQGGETPDSIPEMPPLAKLVEKRASFDVLLIGQSQEDSQPIGAEENDLDIRVTAVYDSGQQVTLYRSGHTAVERVILQDTFLAARTSQIEREAILGLYPRTAELASKERLQRRLAAHALLDKPEQLLAPEERPVAATLLYGEALLSTFRIFNNAPPPGAARKKLHESAVEECSAIVRLLAPIIAAEPNLDYVGMAFWSLSALANLSEISGSLNHRRSYTEAALSLVRNAASSDCEEPEYRRWMALVLERLARILDLSGDGDDAFACLTESVQTWQRLYEELPNAGRHRDLQRALAGAIQWVQQSKIGDPETERHWMTMSSELDAAASNRPVPNSNAKSRSVRST